MKTKLLRYTDIFSRAISLGSHINLCSQNAFVLAAIEEKLNGIDDDRLNSMMAEYATENESTKS